MILSQDGTSITAPISFRKCVVGAVSLKATDNTMCSASAVDKSISVCSLDLPIIGHPAHLIENPVLEHVDARS